MDRLLALSGLVAAWYLPMGSKATSGLEESFVGSETVSYGPDIQGLGLRPSMHLKTPGLNSLCPFLEKYSDVTDCRLIAVSPNPDQSWAHRCYRNEELSLG